MPQIIAARSLAEVVALADNPPLDLYAGVKGASRESSREEEEEGEVVEEEEALRERAGRAEHLVLYIVRVPGSKGM